MATRLDYQEGYLVRTLRKSSISLGGVWVTDRDWAATVVVPPKARIQSLGGFIFKESDKRLGEVYETIIPEVMWSMQLRLPNNRVLDLTRILN